MRYESRHPLSYLVVVAQVLLISSLAVAMDVLYRWHSLLQQLVAREVIATFAHFVVVFALLACIAAFPYAALIAACRRWRPQLVPALSTLAQFVICFLFVRIQFTFFTFWIDDFLRTQHFDRGDRIVALVVLLSIPLLFFILHLAVVRKHTDASDTPRIIAVLLVSFLLIVIANALVSIVIEHHPEKTAFFRSYGWVPFVGYFLLYRRNIAAVLSRDRLFTIPAGALTVLGAVVVGYAWATFSPIPEISIDASVRVAGNRSIKRIILVTFDGLSANRMSLYGNPRPTTPNLNAFAATSYVFDRMHAEADETGQSITAMHTGMHYMGNRVPEYGLKVASGNIIGYMPRVFAALGWENVYLWYSPNLHLGSENIFTYIAPYNGTYDRYVEQTYGGTVPRKLYHAALRGSPYAPAWVLAFYQSYLSRYVGRVSAWVRDQPRAPIRSRIDGPGSDRYDMALEYLRDRKSDNVFLWLHHWAPHQPYLRSGGPFLDEPGMYEDILAGIPWNGAPLDPQYEPQVQKLRLLSEEYIAGADDAFGRFLEYLRTRGLYDDTMIIVSADHGQAFGKGDLFHLTRVMYEQTAWVPLIIHVPGQTEGRRIRTLAQSVDVMPTVLDALGMPAPGWMEGESLLRYVDRERGGAPVERTTFSQAIPQGLSLFPNDATGKLATLVVYRGDYKIIYRLFVNRRFEEIDPPAGEQRFFDRYPRVELYNLARDPNEDQNVVDRELEVKDALLQLVQQRVDLIRSLRAL